MTLHLVRISRANGEASTSLSEDSTPATALHGATATFKNKEVIGIRSEQLIIESDPVDQDLLDALNAHPSSDTHYSNDTTDVRITCDGSACWWETTITGTQDKYGWGGRLFTAHQAAMITKAIEGN